MKSGFENIINKIESVGQKLKDFGVLKIGLFGSCLHGEETENSDVDLLVTLSEEGEKNYINLWIYLDELLEKKVDLVIEDNLIDKISYVKQEARYARL